MAEIIGPSLYHITLLVHEYTVGRTVKHSLQSGREHLAVVFFTVSLQLCSLGFPTLVLRPPNHSPNFAKEALRTIVSGGRRLVREQACGSLLLSEEAGNIYIVLVEPILVLLFSGEAFPECLEIWLKFLRSAFAGTNTYIH